MTNLFYATKNKYKIENMKNRLKDYEIKVITPYDLNIEIDINESETTVIANALLKAKAYYELVKMPTIAGDSSLYIEKFNEQPGLHVKRVNNVYLNDDELEKHYLKALKKVGGMSKAYYITGLVLINNGIINSIEIKEDEFLLTSNIYPGKRNDDALGRLEFNPKINKYFCEMTNEDKKASNFTFDKECTNFILKALKGETHEN